MVHRQDGTFEHSSPIDIIPHHDHPIINSEALNALAESKESTAKDRESPDQQGCKPRSTPRVPDPASPPHTFYPPNTYPPHLYFPPPYHQAPHAHPYWQPPMHEVTGQYARPESGRRGRRSKSRGGKDGGEIEEQLVLIQQVRGRPSVHCAHQVLGRLTSRNMEEREQVHARTMRMH